MKTDIPAVVGPGEGGPLGADRAYEDLGELGRGGMGVVRRMWDPRILRATAFKVVDPARARPEVVQRFIHEAQITGQLEHPHIVPVHEFGVDRSGRLYISLKLVEGETLARRVRRLGDDRVSRDNLGDLIQILIRVCEAMAYAHSRGVIHRDLKPSNVMCGAYGQVYVVDWGIARRIASGGEAGVRLSGGDVDRDDALIGTPAWMAPEQAVADHATVDARTDVFALGALLYFVLTGRAPYVARDTAHVVRKAQLARYPRPSEIEGVPPFPMQLERIALRAMSPLPEDRYGEVQEMIDDLRRFLRGTWSFPVRRLEAGAWVFRQGAPGDTAYVIQRGELDVVDEAAGGRVLRRLGPGDSFGEMAVFRTAPRSAGVVARTEVELLEVTRDALSEGLGLNTWMGAFVTALAHRFAEAEARLREMEGA